MKKQYRVGLSEVRQFARQLASELSGGEILALVGQLGSGKTTLTQNLARHLGVKQKVKSPTFIVRQDFPTKLNTPQRQKINLVHLDLYRTKSFADVKALGLDQIWGQPNAITIIEWADKIRASLPKTATIIYLKRDVK